MLPWWPQQCATPLDADEESGIEKLDQLGEPAPVLGSPLASIQEAALQTEGRWSHGSSGTSMVIGADAGHHHSERTLAEGVARQLMCLTSKMFYFSLRPTNNSVDIRERIVLVFG